jgi:AraC-like DNA-binding protein
MSRQTADTLWHTASVVNGLVDHRGVMHLSLLKAVPDDYVLQVKADGQTEPLTISFRITPPWWQTVWARSIFALLLIGMLIAAFVVYTRITRLRIRQRHKEEILLMRIRNLIEREKLREESESEVEDKAEEPEEPQEDAAKDNEFVNRAIELVERNINTKGYSVEQLSRDLCMERTGLYKKMTTLLDKSPSLFIRSIRLQHAERLLIESDLSIADVAEQTGFSSASHMSKCFQEERGCTPKQVRERKGRD